MLLISWLIARRLHSLARAANGNLLSDSLHAALPPALTAGRRVLIVGDLHGCFEELQDMLQLCGYRAGQDVLISVGDLVNKGPDSAAVLRWFAEGGPLVHAVRGNHDELALGHWRSLRADPQLLQDERFERYRWLEHLDVQLVRFLDSLPLTLRLPAHRVVVVHAGLVPGVPLSKQLALDCVSMRNCVAIQGDASPGVGGPASDATAEAALAHAAALEAAGILASGSLSSLDVGGAELSGSTEPDGCTALPGSSGSSSGDGSSGSDGGGGSSSSKVRHKLTPAQLRERSEGLDWQQALLAYVQLAEPGGSARAGQRQRAPGAENRAPSQQQQQQQPPGGPFEKPPAAALAADRAARGPAQPSAQLQRPVRVAGEVAGDGPRLVGTSRHTLGVPWARAWSEFAEAAPQQHQRATSGCEHAVFGHDAKRLLQLERCATGLDGGLVYGGELYCLLLPPLDERGKPLLEQAGAPPSAQQLHLCSGLPAFVVSVLARQAHAPTG